MDKLNSEKHIGLVKWFHDQTRDANYGFIQHAKLGDLFFMNAVLNLVKISNYFVKIQSLFFTAKNQKSIKEN